CHVRAPKAIRRARSAKQGRAGISRNESGSPLLGAAGSPEATVGGPERQVPLLRNIVGNPFRPTVVERSWFEGNDGCVARVARTLEEVDPSPACVLAPSSQRVAR